MKHFNVTLKHDAGEITIKTAATTREAAIQNVISAENAPKSAVIDVQETIEKYPFLCCSMLDNVLIWDYYGYWMKNGRAPEWSFEKGIRQQVQAMIKKLKPPALKVEIETFKGEAWEGKSWHGKWIIYDENNPHITEYSGAVGGCATEQGAHNCCQNNFYKLKSLYDGDVYALLAYKKTGIPCLPDWNTNKIDTYGYKFDQVNTIPRTREVLANPEKYRMPQEGEK